MPTPQNQKIMRAITNFWTVSFIVFVIINFLTMDRYNYLIGPLSVVYVGILGLYAGTKEFDRWYDLHESRHPGELFVFVWTAVVFALVGASIVLGKEYKVPSEIVADYIMVLSVFVLTKKSKRLYRERSERKLKKH